MAAWIDRTETLHDFTQQSGRLIGLDTEFISLVKSTGLDRADDLLYAADEVPDTAFTRVVGQQIDALAEREPTMLDDVRVDTDGPGAADSSRPRVALAAGRAFVVIPERPTD